MLGRDETISSFDSCGCNDERVREPQRPVSRPQTRCIGGDVGVKADDFDRQSLTEVMNHPYRGVSASGGPDEALRECRRGDREAICAAQSLGDGCARRVVMRVPVVEEADEDPSVEVN